MSDYFLNKIYDSLLANKTPKAKSTFRTLSESYNLVYEEEQQTTGQVAQIAFNVNEPVLTLIPWTPQQANLYRLTDKKGPEIETGEVIEGEAETGVGPGEYAVASVVSGKVVFDNELKNMVSGQSESFDVSWPSKDSSQFTFEVKKMEGEDVRVGRKGAEFGKRFINTVENILRNIKAEYNSLNEEDKKIVNGTIISNLDKIEEPQMRTKRQKGKDIETKGSIEAREKYAKQIAKRTNWTIDRYVDSVLENMSELPLPLIFGKQGKDYEYPTSGKNVARQELLIMSLNRLITVCESISKKEINDTDSESEQAVKSIFRKVYAADEHPSFKDYLDQEARNVDKRITKQKAKVTKEEGAFEIFFDSVKDFKFGDELKNLQQAVIDKQTIEDLFPNTITGLFIVTREGYHYLPQKDISTYVEVSRISQGRPKIKFKGAKADANI